MIQWWLVMRHLCPALQTPPSRCLLYPSYYFTWSEVVYSLCLCSTISWSLQWTLSSSREDRVLGFLVNVVTLIGTGIASCWDLRVLSLDSLQPALINLACVLDCLRQYADVEGSFWWGVHSDIPPAFRLCYITCCSPPSKLISTWKTSRNWIKLDWSLWEVQRMFSESHMWRIFHWLHYTKSRISGCV